MTLAAQIIDQQVSGVVERHSDAFAGELRLGRDEHRWRAVAFLFLAARTAFHLADEEALDGIVGGGDDFGIDALYFEPPDDGELRITVVQGKYRQDLGGDSAFPERGVAGLIDAIGALFDPARPVRLNRRLNERIEEVRSFVKDGAIPRVTAVAANNGARWTAQAQQRIDNAAPAFGDQVEWRHLGGDEILWNGPSPGWATPTGRNVKIARCRPTSSRAPSSPRRCWRSGATARTRRGSGAANTSARCTGRSSRTI